MFLFSLASSQSCLPNQFIDKSYAIQQTQQEIPVLNVKGVKLNGTLTIKDCSVVLSNFDFYPPFVKTVLYGSNDPDPNNDKAEGYEISLKEIEPAVLRNMTYELNGVDALQQLKVIKFYSKDANLVLGYAKLEGEVDTEAKSSSFIAGVSYLVLVNSIIY